MNRKTRQISNPFSTGGGGHNFETRVQAAFTVLLLTEGFTPCLPVWPIVKIKLQGKRAGFDTDDMIVFRKEPNGEREARLLVQVKHAIKITKSSTIFSEVIQAAWNDFNNPNVFRTGIDSLALITGPLNKTDMEVRIILEWARHCEDAKEFLTNVNLANFSSSTKRAKLDVFRSQLKAANGGSAVTDEKLWEFLKSYHLLGYDLDIQAGVTHSLLHSLIGQYSVDNARAVWALVVDEVQAANQNPGTITRESLSEELRDHFEKKIAETIPTVLTRKASSPVAVDLNQKPFAAELATALLLGGWDDTSEGDIQIAAQLAKGDFDHWIPKIREILQDPESPLSLRNGTWTVKRKRETWQTLGSRIFDTDLDVFQSAAVSVLSERDPIFTLPPDARFMARVQGKVLSHSHTMRKGLSDTLALLGSQPKVLTHCSQGKPEIVARLVVREVLDGADWVVWGSLNDLLPLLAEAAPTEFMNAVESALQLMPCPFVKLFEQEGTGISGGNYLTGLLWSLESLAWDEEYLSRVAVILGELSVIDPGGNWSNRPANSLTMVFLPWLPQTTASMENRRVAIQTLKKEVPSCAWHTLLSLLPNQHQTSYGTHKPIWRQTIPENWEKGVAHREYREQVSFYADLTFQMAEGDSVRMAKLVGVLDNLPLPVFDKLLEYLGSVTVAALPEADRTRLWSALVEFTAKHRRYAYTDLALGSDLLDKIDEVAMGLAPESPFKLRRRLFSGDDFALYEQTGDWEEQAKILDKRRQSAIREIYASGGADEVVRFSNSVASPSQVGSAFGMVASEKDDAAVLPVLLSVEDKALAEFIASFVLARHWAQGWEWVDKMASKDWTKPQLGKFLTSLPFTSETWTRACRLLGKHESEYWSEVLFNPFQAPGEFETAIDKLLEHGRPNAAIDCLSAARHKKNPLDHDRTVSALLAAVSSDKEAYPMNIYYAIELIKALQEDSQTDPSDIFKIEWAYLSVLDGHRGASPRFLEQRLASEPMFFCEVIRVIFRSRNEDADKKEPSDQQRALASKAYRLLHKWRITPGALPDESFSREQLNAWLEYVKSACKASGHLEVALSQIGQVLIHTPPDPDGLWVHKAVAEVLNAKDAEGMRRGFRTGVFNSRGVQWVDPTGAPERELAAKYRQQADDAENCGYHRLAVTMRGLAETYSREADRIIAEHDEETEQ